MVLFQVGRQVLKIQGFTSSVFFLGTSRHTGGNPSLSWMATYCYIYHYINHIMIKLLITNNNELSWCIFRILPGRRVVTWCALGPDALAGEAVMAVAALEALATNAWLSKTGDRVILRVSPWRARIRSSTVPCSVWWILHSIEFHGNSSEFHWTDWWICCFFLFQNLNGWFFTQGTPLGQHAMDFSWIPWTLCQVPTTICRSLPDPTADGRAAEKLRHSFCGKKLGQVPMIQMRRM